MILDTVQAINANSDFWALSAFSWCSYGHRMEALREMFARFRCLLRHRVNDDVLGHFHQFLQAKQVLIVGRAVRCYLWNTECNDLEIDLLTAAGTVDDIKQSLRFFGVYSWKPVDALSWTQSHVASVYCSVPKVCPSMPATSTALSLTTLL
jgi:hypothetical protein